MGWILGLLGGLANYLLLRCMTGSFVKGRTGRIPLLLLGHLVCTAGPLFIASIWWRDSLVACAAAEALAMIAGAAALWAQHARK